MVNITQSYNSTTIEGLVKQIPSPMMTGTGFGIYNDVMRKFNSSISQSQLKGAPTWASNTYFVPLKIALIFTPSPRQ